MDEMQHEEFEYPGADEGLRKLHMPDSGREQWLAIMGALEKCSYEQWGEHGGLYWYVSRELYGSSEYKWRAYASDNLTEITLEWPRS